MTTAGSWTARQSADATAQWAAAGYTCWWPTGYGPTAQRQLLGFLCWQSLYGSMVRQLERDLSELLSFLGFPRHLWKNLPTTNIIERCFAEVRRRTGPMVCFVNVKSVDRIIYSIFQRFNLEWKTRTLRLLHKQLDVTPHLCFVDIKRHRA